MLHFSSLSLIAYSCIDIVFEKMVNDLVCVLNILVSYTGEQAALN